MVLDKLTVTFGMDSDDDDLGLPKPNSRKRKARQSPQPLVSPGLGTPLSESTSLIEFGGHDSADRFEREAEDERRGSLEPGGEGIAETASQSNELDEEVFDTTEVEIDPGYQALEEQDEVEGAIVLDPKTAERQYYRDPITGLQREIWLPGDGDGEKSADYFEKPGAPAPLEKRWRFYQSRTGPGLIKPGHNEPPKYVILDDRATHEVLKSDIPRSYLVQHWGHDFGGVGTVRYRRPHRGRGAIGDPDATGDDRYHFTKVGQKGGKYYFTGFPGYKAIIYQTTDPNFALKPFQPKKKRQLSPPRKKELRWNQHGHNQFTPKDQLVKYGAPHKGTSWLRYKDRINTFLPRNQSPPEARIDRGRAIPQTVKNLEFSAASSNLAVQGLGSAAGNNKTTGYEDSLWLEESPRAVKRRKRLMQEENGGDEGNDVAMADPTLRDETPQRTNFSQNLNFFEQMAADQEADSPSDAPFEPTDAGSYASKLEAELEEAKTTIEVQKAEIDRLEQKVKTLKGDGEVMEE